MTLNPEDHPFAARRETKGLVFGSLGVSSLASALVHALGGWDVRYLSTRLDRTPFLRWLDQLAIRPVSLETEPAVPLGEHSYDEPLYAARDYVDSLQLGPVLDLLAARYRSVPHARDAFNVALVKWLTEDALGTFIIDSWIRARGYRRARIISRSRNETVVFSWMGTPAAPRASVRSQIGARQAQAGLRRSRALLGRSRARLLAPRAHDQSTARPADTGSGGAQRPEVIMVFNQGDNYGRLYSYDHLFSTDPESALHRPRTALMSSAGGRLAGGGEADPFPIGGGWLQRRRAARILYRDIRAVASKETPRRLLWFLATLSAQVDGSAEELSAKYPSARLACLVYEIQVPIYLSLGFDVAGIRTIALNERPETAFEHASPIVVSTSLAGSEFLAEALRESWSTAITRAEAVGMWRTDLLHEARAETPPARVCPDGPPDGPLIVALPYHVDHSSYRPGDPVATAAQTMEHFLSDMLTLAIRRPETTVVIRGKNAEWVTDPRLERVVEGISRQPNISINDQYEQLNESYRICAQANLVIGKATSLIDECLAVGIPCVIHDYTANTSGSRQRILSYLPRELWALDDDELERRVAFALDGDGVGFQDWWDPHRRRIYGEYNDGTVRQRARGVILSQLSAGGGR